MYYTQYEEAEAEAEAEEWRSRREKGGRGCYDMHAAMSRPMVSVWVAAVGGCLVTSPCLG
jgi:hypothetical protein